METTPDYFFLFLLSDATSKEFMKPALPRRTATNVGTDSDIGQADGHHDMRSGLIRWVLDYFENIHVIHQLVQGRS